MCARGAPKWWRCGAALKGLGTNDIVALTFDQWKRLGFRVAKGEKSAGRNTKGVCLFTEAQVLRNEDFDECSADASDLY